MEEEPIIPVIIYKNDAGFLGEKLVSQTNLLGFDHRTDIPYRVMCAQDGDIIFRQLKVPAVVYHFCSSTSFNAILKSKVIRMSDARFCNDKKELIQSIDVLSKIISLTREHPITDEVLSKWNSQFSANRDENPAIITDLKLLINELSSITVEERTLLHKQGLDQITAELSRSLTDFIIDQNPIYISCFCEQGDIKSQWMEYANRGKGIAIGFNVDYLKSIENVLFRRVLYYKNELFEFINNNLMAYAFDRKKIKDWFTNVLPVIKHEMWKEEMEWRLIYTPSESEKNPLQKGENESIFYELPFQFESISKIILGPDCEYSKVECIKMLKENYGLSLREDQVIESEVPYQNKKSN